RGARDPDPPPPAGSHPRRARGDEEAGRRRRPDRRARPRELLAVARPSRGGRRRGRGFPVCADRKAAIAAGVALRGGPPLSTPPLVDETLRQVIDEHGREVATPPAIPDEDLRALHRHMLKMRLLDARMLSLQRQGRIGFYGMATGQEASVTGSAYPLKPSDWI